MTRPLALCQRRDAQGTAGGKLPDASPRCQGWGSDGAPLAGGQAVGSLAGMPGLSRREAGCCPAAHTGPTIGGYAAIVGRPGSGLGRRRAVDSGQVSCWMGTWAQILPSGHLGGQRPWVAPGKSSRWGEDGLPGRRHDWLPRTPIRRAHARHARPPAVTGTVIHGVPEGATTVPTRQRRLPVLPRVAGPSQAGSATRHRAAICP